jgi:hypothetical protein
MEQRLLDESPLAGPVAVSRWLPAERDAHLVDPSRLSDATAAVESVCNIWGGAYHLLIPIPDRATSIPDPWLTLVVNTDPTRTALRGRLSPSGAGRAARSWRCLGH